LFNIDADEKALAHLQPPPAEPEPVVVIEKKKYFDEDGNEIEGEEEEEEAPPEEEEVKKPKIKEIVRPIAPVLIGRPVPSIYDTMIELKWKGLQLSSSTMMCMSNWTERLTIVAEVELKTRKRTLKKTYKNN
jgi:hypothetical protein